MTSDFLFQGSTDDLDPELNRLIGLEDRRQQEKIILVASESIAPFAVRELMATRFANVYAEGYPREASRQQSTDDILDIEAELANYRRNSDPRYYKGVEYADILEALARRRAAELFASNEVSADDLYVNVQPLSGSPANTAVYNALLEPGDTIMGLDLNHGGHLTHGSPVSRSGQLYNAVPYTLDMATERLDYDAIEKLAAENRPKLIIAGFTAYPLRVDWKRFRQIADSCNAFLMADIAHISGLVAAGVHPSPVGIADVITTTTHKSLCGPRGAMIMTHRAEIASRIDRAVFPGQQGGPHLNTIASLALALKVAKTERFRALQRRIVDNASCLATQLEESGLRVVSGGSETHLVMVDTKSVERNGVDLSGDMAARILDVAGIVVNRNTIPGDKSAFASSGVRMGTVWVSQLGFGKAEIVKLAEAISTVLNNCYPFTYLGKNNRKLKRAKVAPDALAHARSVVRGLTGIDYSDVESRTILLRGNAVTEFLDYALTNNASALPADRAHGTHLFGHGLDTDAVLKNLDGHRFTLELPDIELASQAATWLRDLSDGYVRFDEDLQRKLPGPIVVEGYKNGEVFEEGDLHSAPQITEKPYFVGLNEWAKEGEPLPAFEWSESQGETLKKTVLHETHLELGGRMVPFAGWDMPVWYSSVGEEHAAVRNAAGLFDVAHMGIFEVAGAMAEQFLNLVATNDVSKLEIGRSQYTFLLSPSGSVIDDLLIYRAEQERFILVVNAANNDKDWAWINAVNNGQVLIDSNRPWVKSPYSVYLRDLRDPRWGEDCLVDIAIQGPASRKILLTLSDVESKEAIKELPWSAFVSARLQGIKVIISRTGYTGERVAFEIFVHPKNVVSLWSALMNAGRDYGLLPCGLAARDSTRIEAGLPLYGHELAGPLDLSPSEASFGTFVKMWKPYFVGRKAYKELATSVSRRVVRFKMDDKGVRRPDLGDPVLDRRGKVIGTVTSCTIDSDGFLTGQAVVPVAFDSEGTTFEILQLGGGRRRLKVPEEITLGVRMQIPDRATVTSRFLKK